MAGLKVIVTSTIRRPRLASAARAAAEGRTASVRLPAWPATAEARPKLIRRLTWARLATALAVAVNVPAAGAVSRKLSVPFLATDRLVRLKLSALPLPAPPPPAPAAPPPVPAPPPPPPPPGLKAPKVSVIDGAPELSGFTELLLVPEPNPLEPPPPPLAA
jgi:hypothetical protein